MISVALTCTRNNRFGGDPCPEFFDNIEPTDVIDWYQAKIRENAWTEEDGKPYCPRHNPADNGAVIQVKYGDDYQPIGDSGWEVRMPRNGNGLSYIEVEVRQIRKDGDG